MRLWRIERRGTTAIYHDGIPDSRLSIASNGSLILPEADEEAHWRDKSDSYLYSINELGKE